MKQYGRMFCTVEGEEERYWVGKMEVIQQSHASNEMKWVCVWSDCKHIKSLETHTLVFTLASPYMSIHINTQSHYHKYSGCKEPPLGVYISRDISSVKTEACWQSSNTWRGVGNSVYHVIFGLLVNLPALNIILVSPRLAFLAWNGSRARLWQLYS